MTAHSSATVPAPQRAIVMGASIAGLLAARVDEQVGIVDAAVTAPAGPEAVALLLDGKDIDQAPGGSGASRAALDALRSRQPTGNDW